MRRNVISVCLLLFVFSGSAWAKDIVATWKYSDGSTMKVSARDDQHVRMDSAPDSYTLLTNGKVYMVQRDDDGWQATDVAKMAGMMGGMFGQKNAPNFDDYKTSYNYLGRKEKIAGYKGKVYKVEVRDGGGKMVSSDELVLSKSKDIRRINMAMMQISSRMSSMVMPGMAKTVAGAEKQADKYGSLLRSGKDMTLISVKKSSLQASYFDLPKGTSQREMKAPPRPPQPSNAGANERKGGFFGDLVNSSGDAAKDQTQGNAADEARKGVNSLFKNMFK